MELEAAMVLVSSGDGLEGPGKSAAEGRTGDAPVAGGAEKPWERATEGSTTAHQRRRRPREAARKPGQHCIQFRLVLVSTSFFSFFM